VNLLQPASFWLERNGNSSDDYKLSILEEPLYEKSEYEEQTLYGSAALHWRGFKGHQWLIGTEYEDTDVTEGRYSSNYDRLTKTVLPEMRRQPIFEQWVSEAVNRSIFSLFIQDQFCLFNRLNLTLGLRYDNYEDSEDRFTPRLAAVYKITDKHILKTQYAQAFRPPVFEEGLPAGNQPTTEDNNGNTGSQDNNPSLEPEIITTLETGYIYRSRYWTGRTNVFISELQNLIRLEEDEEDEDEEDQGINRNQGNAVTFGAEVELDVRFSRFFMIQGNLSYVKALNPDTEDQVEFLGTTRLLGNLTMVSHPVEDLSLTCRYRYIGSRYRGPNDPRDDLDSSHTIDIAAAIFDLLIPGLDLKGGIRNLFDEDVKSPSDGPYFYEDYPQPGREYWMGMIYEF